MSKSLAPSSPDAVLAELRRTCSDLRDRIKRMSPPVLIGYLWAQVLMSLISRHEPDRDGDRLPSVAPQENTILFAMEYVHASIAVDGTSDSPEEFCEKNAQEIIRLSDEALRMCFHYQMLAAAKDDVALSIEDRRLAHQILSNWVMIRGRRFQVLEEEFFSYVLKPHTAELQNSYGITSDELAAELQKVANAPREGLDAARNRLIEIMQEIGFKQGDNEADVLAALEATENEDSTLREEVTSIYEDMFNGGLFKLNKHSDLPDKLLDDLSFEPGSNTEFDDGSEVAGTPFKTLPARVRPAVKLGFDYYCTEPNFIRDASYRSIQRSLVRRNPNYREKWNKLQKRMSENAFADLMSDHLSGAIILKDVYYPIGKKKWAETDCVIIVDDVLINVEAKAGAEALAAPAENLKSHVRSIEKLVRDAYKQSERFLDYLYSRPEAPLYERCPDGKYREVARVKSSDLRKVFPIGLTVEVFTPFSASIKEGKDVNAIQGKHDFISLSIDDLMVIRRLLRSTGEFLHYLDVRQGLAGMKNVMLFDEMDHLGSYISQNRADQRLRELIAEKQVDQVWVDGMDKDVIDPYFANPDWPDCEKPAQEYPPKTLELLSALENVGETGWLDADSFIRDLSWEGRQQFETNFDKTFDILNTKPTTYFAMGGGVVAMFGMMRFDLPEFRDELRKKAEALCLAFEVAKIRLFELAVMPDKKIVSAQMRWVLPPPALRSDYSEIKKEAERLKLKF